MVMHGLHWVPGEASLNHTATPVDPMTSAHEVETQRTRRSTKTPQRPVLDSSQGLMCLRGQRESGSKNAMLRGSFVVLCDLCVSKTRTSKLTRVESVDSWPPGFQSFDLRLTTYDSRLTTYYLLRTTYDLLATTHDLRFTTYYLK